MPARTPPVAAADREQLSRLGQLLRRVRREQKVSAVAAAEAAGMSRVTLHRIEQGEPSVTAGAWVALANALGLNLALVDPNAASQADALPERIGLDAYPQLKALAWQLHAVDEVSPKEALQLYERNWRHLDAAALSPEELALIRTLTRSIGGGRLLV
jgi:transcriptional regulator with XRE-family HTH domain